MKRALDLALKNSQGARPNPSVGALIVIKDTVLGEGFTSNYGGNHAEINALEGICKKNLNLLSQATLYVTLEPCSHTGQTPPCSLAIIRSGIPKVVIGCLDPNPKVSGRGVKLLSDAKIEVIIGVLENECREAHRHFLTSQNLQRPHITLKWAESKDAFIAPSKEKQLNPKSYWLSHSYSKQWSHKLRAQSMGILIGAETMRLDQPSLNTRLWKGKDPVIYVLGGKFSDIPNAWFKKKTPIFQFTQTPEKQKTRITQIKINDLSKSVDILLRHCEKHQVQSLLIEGGTQVINQFLTRNLWDKAIIFKSLSLLHDGVKAPFIDQRPIESIKSSKDHVLIFRNSST